MARKPQPPPEPEVEITTRYTGGLTEEPAAPDPERDVRFVLIVDGEEIEGDGFTAHEQDAAFAALAELREQNPDRECKLLDRSTQTRY